jgi:hypothetical protein
MIEVKEDLQEEQVLDVEEKERPAYLFKPGQSGNPKGRPKGSKNKMKALAEGLIGTNASKIVRKVISMALEGNEACLKMCMDRIIPAQRAVDIDKREQAGQTINITVESMKEIPHIDVVPTRLKDQDDAA